MYGDMWKLLVYLLGSALLYKCLQTKPYRCVKSVQIRIYFWSVFSRIWTEIQNSPILSSAILTFEISHHEKRYWYESKEPE